MAKTVEENAAIVLETLYTESPKTSSQFEIDGKRIQALTNLTPQEINDAVSILRRGTRDVLKYLNNSDQSVAV